MWKKALLILAIIFLASILTICYLISQTVSQIKQGNFFKASELAKKTLFFTQPASIITLHKNPNIELLNTLLIFTLEIPHYTQKLSLSFNQNVQEEYVFDIKKFNNSLEEINGRIQKISKLIDEATIAKKFIKSNQIQIIRNVSKDLPDLITILDNFSKKDQNIIVIFQNSDEIRATGGFMGSYAIIDINDGKVTEISIEDIYDADGQFEGFVQAPSGVLEYLSEGKGLRLPNANWHANFPSSAEQILQFFALGNKKSISTLIAVNLDYAKLLLNILGDITLKDYNTVVDSNNINEVLRSRRSTFFPGSKQKKHLLSQLLTQLKIEFFNLDEKLKVQLAKETFNQLILNNIQLYSTVNEIDSIFAKNNFRQELKFDVNSEYLYLVESNVGINKANKNILREVTLELGKTSNNLKIKFINNNFPPTISNLYNLIKTDSNLDPTFSPESPTENLNYINYQRIIIRPNWKINSVKYNNQEITEWNENIITNSKNEQFKEIGFLITLKEQESSILEIEFENNNLNNNQIYIQKQPGLTPIPYIIIKDDFMVNFVLEKNSLLELF
ncbi:MAG: DUF4012 domain-containing protein [Pseudomonadales bacterium]|nr:DUF4012 domain-containing protein [Pseudomonadales bacterium]